MNCGESRERLPGRLMDALPDEESAQVDRHLESCAECRAEMATVRARLGLLAAWPEAAPPSDLAARTMARLAEAPTRESGWRRLVSALDRGLENFGAHRPTRLTGLATVAVALALLIPVLSPNWNRGRSSGALSGCRSNLRVLGKALDQFASEHGGRYPARLGELHPKYVQLFPECPHAGRDTYGSGYLPSDNGQHYRLSCSGNNHQDAGLPADEPEIRH